MTGKERVLKALKFQEVDRVPWVPFTGVHVAKLIGADAETLLKDENLLVEAVCAAGERRLTLKAISHFVNRKVRSAVSPKGTSGRKT